MLILHRPASPINVSALPQAILIMMQDVLFSQTLRHKLRRFRAKVFLAETPAEALELLGIRKMDVILLDVRGNNLPAGQFLKDLKRAAIEVETILISSIEDVAISIECWREGASDEITVPFDIDSLKAKIKEAFRRSRLHQEKKNRKLPFAGTLENAMVAATFAQGGEVNFACAFLDKKEDDVTMSVRKPEE